MTFPVGIRLLGRIAVLSGAVLVFAGLPASLWFARQEPPMAMSWPLILASWTFGAVVVAILCRFAARPVGIARVALDRLPSGLAWPLAIGVVLRVGVAIVVDAVPTSDSRTYLGLAVRLASLHEYGVPGARAFWPPGLPLVLAPLVEVFGSGSITLILYALLTFVLAACGIQRLGEVLGFGRRTNVAVWLLALWPNLLLCAGLPEKELLLVALLPWMLWSGVRAARGSNGAAVLCGVLIGLCTLSQPSLQLMVFVPFVFIPFMTGARWPYVARCILIVLVTGSILVPWVYRNARVLDAPVLATNGGSNFYRANNDLATGAFMSEGTVDVDRLDEVESDAAGRTLALEWIRAHPARFVQLTAGRMLLFAGDDSSGAYGALRRGQPSGDRWFSETGPYAVIKLLVATPWLLLWALAAAMVGRRRVAGSALAWTAAVAFVPYLYLTCIHAVFESGGKYHVPTLGTVFVGFACILACADRGRLPLASDDEARRAGVD